MVHVQICCRPISQTSRAGYELQQLSGTVADGKPPFLNKTFSPAKGCLGVMWGTQLDADCLV